MGRLTVRRHRALPPADPRAPAPRHRAVRRHRRRRVAQRQRGRDADAEFALLHDEIFRSGAAYVGVSAQTVGVTGEGVVVPVPELDRLPLREVDPERYGSLEHPGDDYSYDIVAQVAAALRRPGDVDP